KKVPEEKEEKEEKTIGCDLDAIEQDPALNGILDTFREQIVQELLSEKSSTPVETQIPNEKRTSKDSDWESVESLLLGEGGGGGGTARPKRSPKHNLLRDSAKMKPFRSSEKLKLISSDDPIDDES